jgi:hypothetical protein
MLFLAKELSSKAPSTLGNFSATEANRPFTNALTRTVRIAHCRCVLAGPILAYRDFKNYLVTFRA